MNIKERNKLIEQGWKPPHFKKWVPKIKERVWTLDTFNNKCVNYKWMGNNIDANLLSIGLIFKTREEVEKYLVRQKAIVKVNNVLLEKSYGIVVDWEDEAQEKWQVCLDEEEEYLKEGPLVYKGHILLAQPSEAACDYIIENMKDDLDIIFERE